MTGSREKILQNLRKRDLPAAALPDLDQGNWIRYDDPASQFCSMLETVGASSRSYDSWEKAIADCPHLPEVKQANRWASLIEGGPVPTVNLTDIEQPHQLNELDVLIGSGEFGVAENGAIWVVSRARHLQAAYFLAEHLVLLCPASNLAHNMHEAYRRIDIAAQPFGLFLSGPSKTADIEQSLVIGAQGPRALTVMLYG